MVMKNTNTYLVDGNLVFNTDYFDTTNKQQFAWQTGRNYIVKPLAKTNRK